MKSLTVLRRTFLKCLAIAAFCAALPVSAATSPASVGATDNYYNFVFNEPIAGREDEYNRWYNEIHAPGVVSDFPDALDAQRYVANDLRGNPPRKYLVVYHIATNDIDAEFARFKPPGGLKDQPIAPNSTLIMTYKAFGPEVPGVGSKLFGKGEAHSYLLLVRNGPFAGQDDDYNTWYNTRHILDMAATPGIVSAQRLIFADVQHGSTEKPATQYMAMYKIVTDDLAAFYAALDVRGKDFVMSKAWDPSTSVRSTYQTLGPKIDGAALHGARSK